MHPTGRGFESRRPLKDAPSLWIQMAPYESRVRLSRLLSVLARGGQGMQLKVIGRAAALGAPVLAVVPSPFQGQCVEAHWSPETEGELGAET